INDLLVAELSPYDTTRIALEGEPLVLPGKLAVTLALIFHELATNAAKYGALSLSAGHVRISWTAAGRRIEVAWVETGGPKVIAPTRRGFGTKLFRHALDPFHGIIETKYQADGLICSISCSLPDEPSEWERISKSARHVWSQAAR